MTSKKLCGQRRGTTKHESVEIGVTWSMTYDTCAYRSVLMKFIPRSSRITRGLSSGSGDLVRVAVADVIRCDAHRAAMSLFMQLGSVLFGVLSLVLIASPADGFSYEDLPAVAMDYKVHIDAGKEDCYFQYVNPGATFYVSFQVLRGGDGKAGFAVRNPEGIIVYPYQWRANADYQDQSLNGGYYSVCIDNQFSRFAAKLVNLYITVIRYDKWQKYTQELEELNLSVENFTTTIVNVEKNINEMLVTQHWSRSREERDLNLLLDNNSYVQTWSIAQVVIITLATMIQGYFVRKLFDVKPHGHSKTRI